MAIVDYTRDDGDPGYRFKDETGRELYFSGPEADSLAQQIDRFRPMRTASNDAVGDALNARFAPKGSHESPGEYERLDAASDGIVPATDANIDRAIRNPSITYTDPRDLSGPMVPPPGVPVPVGKEASASSGVIDPRITAPVHTPGVSRAQLEAQAAGAVAVPAGQTTSVERSGLPMSPQEIAAVDAANQNEVDVRRSVTRQQIAMNDAASAQAEAQAVDMRRQAAADQADLEARQRATDAAWNDVQEANMAVKNGKIDPERFFKDKSFLQKAGIIFGKALGAFAAIMIPGGQNYAQESIDRMVDADIRAQEDEISRLGSNAGNALAAYQRVLGDEDLARRALRHTMQTIADSERARIGAMYKSADTAQQLALWEAANAKARVKEAIEFKNAGLTKIQTSTSAAFKTPQTSGSRAPTLEEQARRAKAIRTIGQGDNQYESDTARQRAAAFTARQVQDTARQLKTTSRAYASTIALAKRAGLHFDDTTGRFIKPKGADLTGIGLLDRPLSKFAPGSEGALISQSLADVVDLKLRDRSGAAAPESEQERLRKTVIGDGTEAAFVNGMNNLLRDIRSQRDEIMSGVPIEVIQQIEQNRRDLGQHRFNQALEAQEEPF